MPRGVYRDMRRKTKQFSVAFKKSNGKWSSRNFKTEQEAIEFYAESNCKAFVWNSVAGFARFVDVLKPTRIRCTISESEWLDVAPDSNSRIPSVCTVCNVPGTVRLQPLSRRDLPLQSCLCSGLPWNSVQGYNRLKDELAEIHCELLEDGDNWKDLAKTCTSHVKIRCCVCCWEGSATIDHLHRGHRGACFCVGVRWDTKEGRDALERVVDGSRFFVPPNVLPPPTYTAETRLTLECTVCNVVCHPTIAQFVHTTCVGCGCQNSTEQCVAVELESIVKHEFVVVRQQTLPCLVGVGGKPLRYDFAIAQRSDSSVRCLVEVDGGQHFDSSIVFSPNSSNKTVEHDVRKEGAAATCNIPLLRLSQRVVEQNKMEWKSWLSTNVAMACDGSLKQAIVRLGRRCDYWDSEYGRMRGLKWDGSNC